MNCLLDTCVISELVRIRPEPRVLAWIESIPEDRLHLSVLTLGELQKGIVKLGAGPRKRQLEKWLAEDVRTRFAGRILSLDEETLIRWGQIVGEGERRGRVWSLMDSLMAASAIANRLTLVTRNTADVQGMGAEILDPWQVRT